MLGLGRALGETMAVAMVLSASGGRHAQPDLDHQPGDRSPPTSPRTSPRPPPAKVSVLIATGLVLFVDHLRGQLRRPLDRRPQRDGGWRDDARPHLAGPRRSRVAALRQPPAARAGRRCSWPSLAVAAARPARARCSAGASSAWVARRRSCSSSSRCPPGRCVGREPPRRRRPAGHRAGLGGVRRRAAAAGLAALDGGQQGLPGDQRRRSSPTRCATSIGDEQGGIYHALIGTLLITLAATVISVPIGAADRDLPRRVRQGQRGWRAGSPSSST